MVEQKPLTLITQTEVHGVNLYSGMASKPVCPGVIKNLQFKSKSLDFLPRKKNS